LECDPVRDAILVCPSCGGLSCARCGVCEVCGTRSPMEAGVVRLLDGQDGFYEGAYQAQVHFSEASLGTLWGRLLLPFITYGYLKAIVRHVPRGAKLLELGCGSGLQLAATRYEVAAVDLSLTSLKGAPEGYRHRLQADVTRLEFRPATFDAIAASCFWEHIAPEQKEVMLEKFSRWLRPGGLLVLLFDTESLNPFFRWFREFPDLYKQCFVDHDGHVGLERASVNLARLERHGLRLVEGVGLNRTLQHFPVYTWMAPYGEVRRWAGWVSRAGMWLGQWPRPAQASTALLHSWDLTAGRLFPLDWSRLYLGVWRRDEAGVVA